MTENQPLILYSRRDCHLCELAADLLRRMDIAFSEVDVDKDPALQDRYGLSVPVLRNTASSQELPYPFDKTQVTKIVSGQSKNAGESA